jgi:hypothetical protein
VFAAQVSRRPLGGANRQGPDVRIFLFASFILAGCYTQIDKSSAPYLPHRNAPIYRAYSVNSEDEGDFPVFGSYYRLRFMSDTQPIEHIDMMLSDLYSRGFNVTGAWYRSPGSHNRTLISAQLVIHLSERNPEMERFNFEEIPPPRRGNGIGATHIYIPEN